MNKRLYNFYRFSTSVKKRVHRKLTLTGRMVVAFFLLATLFGFNTRLTMIYQLAALAFALLLFSFPLSLGFTPSLRIRRRLPEICTAGERLSYLVEIENVGKTASQGIFYAELPENHLPSFAEFATTVEEREAERNFFDRKFLYYRWIWLIEKKKGARFESWELPFVPAKAFAAVEVAITPLRRGYIHIAGFLLYRPEPFGLFKREIRVPEGRKLLVLPKIYPVERRELAGSRKYHQGGLTSAVSHGETGEFVALREYRQGDPVKHIDWKATAKVGGPIVRQYQDEYFSRQGILLDTFRSRSDAVFEDAVSVAASIVAGQDGSTSNIELLFASTTCVSSLSIGQGGADQRHMLEALACIEPCCNGTFRDLAQVVIRHTSCLSGLILVLLDLDQERKTLLTYLSNSRIPYTVILVSSDTETSHQQMHKMELQQVTIFNTDSPVKVVQLS